MNRLFIIDSNCLISYYENSIEYAKLFLEILNKYENEILITHQVFDEVTYRSNQILRDKKSFKNDELIKQFDLISKSLIKIKKQYLTRSSLDKKEFEMKITEIEEFIQNQKNGLESIIKQKEKDLECYFQQEELVRFLNGYFLNNVNIRTKPLTIETKIKYGIIGDFRYKNNIPPGFKDISKDGLSKYGDLYLWMEIIQFIKTHEDKLDIYFITNDMKEDWWSEGKPHPLLQQEFDESKKNLNTQFNMITLKGFFELVSSEREMLNDDSSNLRVYSNKLIIEEQLVKFMRNELYNDIVQYLNNSLSMDLFEIDGCIEINDININTNTVTIDAMFSVLHPNNRNDAYRDHVNKNEYFYDYEFILNLQNILDNNFTNYISSYALINFEEGKFNFYLDDNDINNNLS